jgi:hypothetical protein
MKKLFLPCSSTQVNYTPPVKKKMSLKKMRVKPQSEHRVALANFWRTFHHDGLISLHSCWTYQPWLVRGGAHRIGVGMREYSTLNTPDVASLLQKQKRRLLVKKRGKQRKQLAQVPQFKVNI